MNSIRQSFKKQSSFKIASDPKYDGYQRGLASMIYKFFDKKSTRISVDAEPNNQLVNELHKQIIRNFKRQKVYSSFRDKIWGVDLADIESLSKYNKGIKFLLCIIDLFRNKRGITIVHAIQKITLIEIY